MNTKVIAGIITTVVLGCGAAFLYATNKETDVKPEVTDAEPSVAEEPSV
ncbi:hypothetical protein PHABIO_154 [Pseudomonas phage Phabio]|uniref:Uncharacterized protein n=1 Tax=Pseudomonas phage Phabio TaxID=2006668 RepID=A0A1Y0SWD2_9CAUD|nr:hypothetical protein MZD05_gp154 [Pseudomonas phage Phabio]ARV76785.1 hypothetical protein PHABIO_154 [Pseudomonas phage Phabio]